MSDLMNNVKTINSAVRTVMAIAVVGILGFGTWYGYTNYIKPSAEAKAALADLKELQTEFDVLSRRNDRLETSLKLLKSDRRMANLTILEKQIDNDGRSWRVQFKEVNAQNEAIGPAKEFSLRGERIYIDGWVVKFDDKYIEEADELRAASLFVFKSIYGSDQSPADGSPLDEQSAEDGIPDGYRSDKQRDFEKQIWGDFWTVCNDKGKQEELGVRASHGVAVSIDPVEGKTYRMDIRSGGDVSIEPIGEQP